MFWAGNGPGRTREVFQKLPGGRALHSGRIWDRGGTTGPHSLHFLFVLSAHFCVCDSQNMFFSVSCPCRGGPQAEANIEIEVAGRRWGPNFEIKVVGHRWDQVVRRRRQWGCVGA